VGEAKKDQAKLMSDGYKRKGLVHAPQGQQDMRRRKPSCEIASPEQVWVKPDQSSQCGCGGQMNESRVHYGSGRCVRIMFSFIHNSSFFQCLNFGGIAPRKLRCRKTDLRRQFGSW